MKPYQGLPIAECGEPLVTIPPARFRLATPHPYVALGAPYHGSAPWRLRLGVLEALTRAQRHLQRLRPGWWLRLFDAYRPIAVQAFMVEREFRQLAGGRIPSEVPAAERAILLERAYRIWAPPSHDPATPPPHSTGAAVDLSLCDAEGREIHMGSPIDENSARSEPDHFMALDPVAHAHRCLLCRVMTDAGFRRHPGEWWHFSLGDQLWAWQMREAGATGRVVARYGRADLLHDSGP